MDAKLRAVKDFEHAIDREMKKVAKQKWFREYHKGSRPRVYHYGIQFLGIERNGVKLIYANGFCGKSRYLYSSWYWAFDGGTCYFGAKYNPETDEIEGLGFNGYA